MLWGWCQLDLGPPLVLKFSPNAPLPCVRPRLALSNVEKRDAAGGGGPAEACPPPTPPMVPGYKLNQLEVFTRRGGLPLSCKLRPLMPDNSSEELEDEWDSSNPHPGGAGGGGRK